MLDFLPTWLKGSLTILLILANTLILYPLLLLLALVKLIIPLKPVRTATTIGLNWVATVWINNNSFFVRFVNHIEWHVEGAEGLDRQQWYLVTCNHQSWADIMVVQNILNSRIPLMKFFLKKELIWVPLLGIAWWALDFPFMKRYTREQIAKKPELKGKDLDTTRRACEKFQYTPVAVFNFMEGTRFTPEKHAHQSSPFRNLLKPRAGGTAFVLGAMGERMHRMLDITIVYPEGVGGIWEYLSGQTRKVVVKIEQKEIPREFLGRNYGEDPEFRKAFNQWVMALWHEKDNTIDMLKARHQ